jgi:perosamine synthetase
VIVPAFTYVSSANAVTYTGAKPVFADSEPLHWNLDPEKISAAITPRTKAIMAVHLYGHPADMRAVRAVADRHRIAVIEDAAEAHGAEVEGRRVGGLGLAAAFSFYGNKILTTGEGGMVTTDDDALAARVRVLRGQGMDPARRYRFEVVGYNYRMTNIAAAIGCAQLERIEELIEGRLRVARCYDGHLAPRAAGLRLQLSSEAGWARNVHWLYCLRVPAAQRDALAAHLFERGIDTRPFFPPMHVLPMYRGQGPFPVAEELAATGLSLPTWHRLDDAAIARVCAEVLGFLGARA